MTDLLLRMLVCATLGLLLTLLLRRPARRVFGASAAFTLWLLPVVLAWAPWLPLPQRLAPAAMVVLPGLMVTPHVVAAPGTAIHWAAWLTALWLSGAGVGLLRLVVHYVHLLRRVRAAPRGWASQWAQLVPAPTAWIARRVRVHPAGPAVLWALPRTLILLPEDFSVRFGTDATRELVLGHELTHARRGDAWWTLAMEVASALLWFHPLAWLARSRFRLDQELACDAASLRAAPECTAGYARALLDSVAVQPVPALIPWLAEPQLKERIAMLERIPPGALRRRAGFLAIAALLAGGLYVAGGQSPVAAATQTSSKSTSPSVDITYKNRNPPHYPNEAIKKGEQGKVLLDITVDATGKVIVVTADPKRSTAPAILQTAAIQAAGSWHFNPGMKSGHPVGGRIEVPVTFSLWKSPGCPDGFRYKHGEGKSFSCIAKSSAPASSRSSVVPGRP